jgi:hypothetical protein
MRVSSAAWLRPNVSTGSTYCDGLPQPLVGTRCRLRAKTMMSRNPSTKDGTLANTVPNASAV